MRRVGDSHVHVRSSERLTEETASDVPVLVHHSSDEKTLSAAAGHLARGGEGDVFLELWGLLRLFRLGHEPAP